jgi:ABC-2 type transport system permease protein
MTGLRQSWLVAVRELRERSRSRAFQASLVVMVLVVLAVIILPAMLDSGEGGARDVGLTGVVPARLPSAIADQGAVVGTPVRLKRYEDRAVGEEGVREGDVDVLVVDARQLEWRAQTDEQLRVVVTGAIQLVAVQQRATAAGISPDDLRVMVAPVPVDNVELGSVAGRSPDDETAAFVMTVLLFIAIATYGAMVLSGVVEEKSSRVVEVLLVRIPARNLLAGKIAGIGLLGLAQFGVTALAAAVAIPTVDSFDVPAARGAVLAWVVVWFVLGYALYATVFGVLGALVSRAEDAQSVTGPVSVVLIASYFVSFAAIGSPEAVWARAVSFFPLTAPLAMPNRIAMGATAEWEPVVAVVVAVAAIAALVHFGGRVYAGAVLHAGQTLALREAWRGSTTPGPTAAESGARPTGESLRKARVVTGRRQPVTRTGDTTDRMTSAVLIVVAASLGVAVAVLVGDVVAGLAVGAGLFAVSIRIAKQQHANHR